MNAQRCQRCVVSESMFVRWFWFKIHKCICNFDSTVGPHLLPFLPSCELAAHLRPTAPIQAYTVVWQFFSKSGQTLYECKIAYLLASTKSKLFIFLKYLDQWFSTGVLRNPRVSQLASKNNSACEITPENVVEILCSLHRRFLFEILFLHIATVLNHFRC